MGTRLKETWESRSPRLSRPCLRQHCNGQKPHPLGHWRRQGTRHLRHKSWRPCSRSTREQRTSSRKIRAFARRSRQSRRRSWVVSNSAKTGSSNSQGSSKAFVCTASRLHNTTKMLFMASCDLIYAIRHTVLMKPMRFKNLRHDNKRYTRIDLIKDPLSRSAFFLLRVKTC